jgi:rhamnogalacturonyl hydrolase YesR
MRLRNVLKAGTVAATVALVGALLVGISHSAGAATAAAAPSPKLTKADILKTMKLVDDYWVKNGTNLAPPTWQNSTFHVGNLAFVTAGGVSNHVTHPWAQKNKYQLMNDPKKGQFFPDFEAVGEVYLDLLAFHQDPNQLTALRSRINAEVASVNAGHVDYWNYVDALNMAMPSFARLGLLDKKEADLAAMQTLFNYTEKVAGGHGLFSESAGLWWRDSKYVNTTTFWSRGNGWAMMALAKVLAVLPSTDPRRAEYLRVYLKMANTLKGIQRSDGFWNPDLGDPKNFPGPETSGTAFFTFAIAWGINHGILPKATYRPVVEKAWRGMVTKSVRSNGLLGRVQLVGQRPSDHQPIKSTDTAAYGVGGFLLAGSQLVTLES